MGTDKVKNNKKKRIPKLPVILGVFVLLFLIALAVVFNAPFFSIKTIEVDELRHYSHDDIAGYLDSYVGTNGFKAVFKNSSLKQTRGIFSLEKIFGTILLPTTSWPWKVQPTEGSKRLLTGFPIS